MKCSPCAPYITRLFIIYNYIPKMQTQSIHLKYLKKLSRNGVRKTWHKKTRSPHLKWYMKWSMKSYMRHKENEVAAGICVTNETKPSCCYPQSRNWKQPWTCVWCLSFGGGGHLGYLWHHANARTSAFQPTVKFSFLLSQMFYNRCTVNGRQVLLNLFVRLHDLPFYNPSLSCSCWGSKLVCTTHHCLLLC